MKLHYNCYGDGFPLIILHGFLGTADNWHSLAQRFQSDFKVIAVDLRNHGRSPHSDYHSIKLMADDLIELMDDLSLTQANFIGHSMGGKVLMHLCLTHAERVLTPVVVDIAPRAYKPGHQDVFDALMAVNLQTAQTRKEVEEAMIPYAPDFGIRQFLLKNLTRNPQGKFTWKMNLPVLFNQYQEVIEPITAGHPFTGRALFIKGATSDYIKPGDEKEIVKLFPLAVFKTIEGAGHWVHADKPDLFYDAVITFLRQNISDKL
ncbi:MAG: alpha/beta fold hydrolase [Bacteroidia bacterium]|nr:alpha/beta fold hydrolase [Bacteroidia bacterium]